MCLCWRVIINNLSIPSEVCSLTNLCTISLPTNSSGVYYCVASCLCLFAVLVILLVLHLFLCYSSSILNIWVTSTSNSSDDFCVPDTEKVIFVGFPYILFHILIWFLSILTSSFLFLVLKLIYHYPFDQFLLKVTYCIYYRYAT